MRTWQPVIPVGPLKRSVPVTTVTGKTMLAQRIPGILPPLTRQESLETTSIYSALGLLPDGVALMDERPVRTPHHSATAQALVGGGSIPMPSEVSLAHHGILFLDELPEFKRDVLEVLRQPLEDGKLTISRAAPGSGPTLALRSRPRPHLSRPPPDDHGDESLSAPRM